jgi:hypothetical protein
VRVTADAAVGWGERVLARENVSDGEGWEIMLRTATWAVLLTGAPRAGTTSVLEKLATADPVTLPADRRDRRNTGGVVSAESGRPGAVDDGDEEPGTDWPPRFPRVGDRFALADDLAGAR